MMVCQEYKLNRGSPANQPCACEQVCVKTFGRAGMHACVVVRVVQAYACHRWVQKNFNARQAALAYPFLRSKSKKCLFSSAGFLSKK